MKYTAKAALLACLLLSCAPLAQTAQTQTAQPQTAAVPRPPLVACVDGQDVPCIVLATKPGDIVGIWKQYQYNPVFAPSGNMGFIRYNPDGTFALGNTPDATAMPRAPFPFGTYRFGGSRMTMNVQGVPPNLPECARAVYEVRVIRLGSRPVALHYTPLEDTCKIRLSDLGYVLPYIGPAR